MKKKIKKKKDLKLSILFFFLGLLIMFYPIIAKMINKMAQTEAISKYTDIISKMDDDEIKKQKKQYEKYNQEIKKNKASYIDLLKKGTLLGYIKIEKINVYLPIYEGTDDKILQQGVGHLEKTSMPTHNTEYHAVFVGHTGLTSKKFFDDLEKLEKGDNFKITILNESFKYKVYDIKVVKPNETNILKVQSNKQLVTLVTCTPKYVNSHRLLIMGEKVSL